MGLVSGQWGDLRQLGTLQRTTWTWYRGPHPSVRHPQRTRSRPCLPRPATPPLHQGANWLKSRHCAKSVSKLVWKENGHGEDVEDIPPAWKTARTDIPSPSRSGFLYFCLCHFCSFHLSNKRGRACVYPRERMRPWLVACLHSLKKDRQGMSLVGDVHPCAEPKKWWPNLGDSEWKKLSNDSASSKSSVITSSMNPEQS